MTDEHWTPVANGFVVTHWSGPLPAEADRVVRRGYTWYVVAVGERTPTVGLVPDWWMPRLVGAVARFFRGRRAA